MKNIKAYYNPDLDHLRQRAGEAGYDIQDGYCRRCGAALTEADLEDGACTQCDEGIPALDDDERK